MSIYLEKRLEFIGDPSPNNEHIKWSHSSDAPLLAVVRNNGEIVVIDEEGLIASNQPTGSDRDHEATAIAWHPKQQTLAIGWNSGNVSFWDDTRTTQPNSVHATAVSLIVWSNKGDRLLTANESGVVFIHAYQEGQLIQLQSYNAEACASHAQFANSRETSSAFLLGTTSGCIYNGDDSGTFSKLGNIGSAINSIFFGDSQQIMVIISVQSVMFLYQISNETKISLKKKVKLSIKGDAANKEPCVRLWSVQSDESIVLPLSDSRHMAKGNDFIVSITYNPRSMTLVGGTAMGRVVMWRCMPKRNTDEVQHRNEWIVLPPVNTCSDSEIRTITASNIRSIAVVAKSGLSILSETTLHYCRMFGTVAAQISADKLILYLANGKAKKLSANIKIQGICLGENVIAVWNGQKVEVNDIADTVNFIASFNSQACCCAIQGQTLYLATGPRVDACNFQGVVKKAFSFSESEGQCIYVDTAGDFLVAVSNLGTIKLWEIGRREARSMVPGRKLPSGLGKVILCRPNKFGSHLAILTRTGDQCTDGIDSRLTIYDVELDRFDYYDFSSRKVVPYFICWDEFEGSLIMVSVRPETEQRFDVDLPDGEAVKGKPDCSSSIVYALFVTSEHGIHFQDKFDIGEDILIGSETPFTYYIQGGQTGSLGSGGMPHVDKRVMRDFVGLDSVDEATRRELAKFSYKMAIGDMDEAYRAVKNIESPSIWKNMAKMCVITRRLDMASICLGNMGFATGSKALREAKQYPEKEAQLACMAIELGMIDEAVSLYKDCGRYDLLISLQKASGRWEDAMKACETHHRIQLKSLRFAHARFLEDRGQISQAITEYEACDAYTEIPRMFLALGRIHDLEAYCEKKGDSNIQIWLGQYNEGRALYENALQYYLAAKEHTSCVRIYCLQSEVDKARAICKETGDLAASYQLGRYLEATGCFDEAVCLYAKAHRFNRALHLAKEHSQAKEVYMFGLQSPPAVQNDAARFLESQQLYDKAIVLYQKAGNLSRALDLCFSANQFDCLASLAAGMGTETSPALITKCASFFLENNQFDKAVQLYVTGRRFSQALDVCVQNRLPISDELAEMMTPTKEENGENNASARNDFLKKLGKYLASIGSYHMATKKFTQAGDKIRAMKCLLKSNDTSKIIYYATMTKKKEIYVLAGNYLQNCDWHSDPELTKTIITFYTKAGAFDQLALFYESCAQREVDDYRDYDKALQAMKESLNVLQLHCNQPGAVKQMERRIFLVGQFVEARSLMSRRVASEALNLCVFLTEQEDIEDAVREGDVFALMIEYLHSKGDLNEALVVLQRMKEYNLDPVPFIKASILKDLDANSGLDAHKDSKQHSGPDADNDIEDDIKL